MTFRQFLSELFQKKLFRIIASTSFLVRGLITSWTIIRNTKTFSWEIIQNHPALLLQNQISKNKWSLIITDKCNNVFRNGPNKICGRQPTNNMVCLSSTAWKVPIFRVFLICIFPHSDWMRTRKTPNTDTFQAVKTISFQFLECAEDSL